MNKTLKGIIAGTGVLAVLGGAMTYLLLTQPEDKPAEESSDSAVETMLWHAQSDDINEIDVENPNGDSYVAVRRIDATPTTDIDGNATVEDIANYFLKGYEDLPMNTTGIRLLATRAPEVSSVDTAAEGVAEADYAKYGLDQPVKVTYHVDNADDITFYIGNEAPIGGNRYLRMENGDTVYLVNSISLEPFFDGIKDYLGTTLKEEQTEDDDTVIKSVRIERQDLDYDFYFVYDPYYKENTNGGAMAVHVMQEPINALISADRSASATHGLYGLTAKEVLTPFPKDADIKAAGLDDPFVTVTMKTDDGKTTEFYLGSTYQTEDGEKRYYGMMKGIDCIYGFSPDDIVYDNLKPEDVISRNVVDFFVWDIGSMEYQAGDIKLSFSGIGKDKDDYVLKRDGEDQDINQLERYRLLYTYLLQTPAEEIVYPSEDVELSGDPLAKVHIERQDGARELDVEYYDAGSMKAYIVVNGEVRFRCRKTYVDTLISNLEIYDDADKEFTMTW